MKMKKNNLLNLSEQKILMVFIMGIMLISFTSALDFFTFDNKVDYSVDKLDVTLINRLDLVGDNTLGKATLASHASVDEIRKVGYGKYEPVMWYDFYDWETYTDAFGNVEFTDMETGKKVEKDYYFAKWTEKTKQVPIYDEGLEMATINKNGTLMQPEKKIIGYGTETYWDWERYDSRDIPYTLGSSVRIALMVYVEKNDYTDAVWTIAGKKISEHAEWSASLEVGIWKSYTYNGDYGIDQEDDFYAVWNATASSGTTNVSGRIGSAYDFASGYIDYKNPSGGLLPHFVGQDYTVNLWVYADACPNSRAFYRPDFFNLQSNTGWYFEGVAGPVTCTTGEWDMITIMYHDASSTAEIVLNYNEENDTGGWGGPSLNPNPNNLTVGNNNAHASPFNGRVDAIIIWNRSLSVSEVSDLYNSGAGLEPEPFGFADSPPNVVINSPPNYDNLTTSTETFNATVTDDFIVQNVSLMINGTIETTNTSNVNGTYQFSVSKTAGFYNWSIIAYDNASQKNESSERFFTITVIAPTVHSYSPEDNLITSTALQTFTGDAYDDFAIQNMSFMWDGAYDQTNTSGINATNYTFSKTLTEGSHTWFFKAFDNDSNPSSSISRTITLDTISPALYDNNISNATATTLPYTLVWNYSASDANIDDCYYYYCNESIASCSNGLTPQGATSGGIFTGNLTYRGYDWIEHGYSRMRFETGSNNVLLSVLYQDSPDVNNDSSMLINATTHVWFLNGTLFDTCFSGDACGGGWAGVIATIQNVTFTAPQGQYLTNTKMYNGLATTGGWSWNNESENETFTVGVDWTGTPYEAIEMVTCNSTIESTIDSEDPKGFKYCANDSAGLETCAYESFDLFYYSSTQSQSTTSVTEGSDITFYLFVNSTSIPDTVAYLYYNNTNYTTPIRQEFTDYTKFTQKVTVPVGWGSATGVNQSANWTYGIAGYGGGILPNLYNTVYSLNVNETCSGDRVLIYNFTIVDEDTQTMIPPNNTFSQPYVEIDMDFKKFATSTNLANYSASFNGTNPITLCTNLQLTGSNKYSVYGTISYENYWGKVENGTGVGKNVQEFYNIQNFTLQNSTAPQTITLYDLSNDTSQVFTIIYKDQYLQPIDDALINVQRFYIDEGIYKVVEIPITDANGETLAHLVQEDVKYNFWVYKNGILLSTFTEQLAKCDNEVLDDCEITLNAISSTLPPNDFTTLEDFTFTFDYNQTTRTAASLFNIPSGTSDTIVLNATVGNTLVCSDTATQVTDTLTCTVSPIYKNNTAVFTLWKGSELIGTAYVGLQESSQDVFSGSQVFLILLLYFTIFGFALSENPMLTGFMFLIGAILAIAINVVNGGGNRFIGAGATFLWLVIAIIIVMVKAGRRT